MEVPGISPHAGPTGASQREPGVEGHGGAEKGEKLLGAVKKKTALDWTPGSRGPGFPTAAELCDLEQVTQLLWLSLCFSYNEEDLPLWYGVALSAQLQSVLPANRGDGCLFGTKGIQMAH